jgi:hypothetical protein
VVTELSFPDGAGVPDLDVAWIHGSAAAKYNTDPDIQVHACGEHTYILRQNKAVHYEAPFMFLLFGGARAVLLDTGATADRSNSAPGISPRSRARSRPAAASRAATSCPR